MAVSGKSPSTAALEVLETNAALMREQIGLARNERFRNRIRAVRDTAIAALVIVLIVTAGVVVWNASRASGLVIQPFTVPPQLAQDGLDGRAVAALFQDELVGLEAATVSARPAASFRNDWSEAITIEVEAGGLSLTEAYRALTRWLGRETLLGGGFRRTPGGLELVVRTSDGTTVTVQGPAESPESLIRKAAERIYEKTQPYRYAVYLQQAAEARPPGPEQQALIVRSRAILRALMSSPSETEQLWALNGLARALGTPNTDVAPLLRTALEIDPEHPIILFNLSGQLFRRGQDEAGLDFARRAAASMSARRNRAKMSEEGQLSLPMSLDARLPSFEGNWLKAVQIQTRNASRFSAPVYWRANMRERLDALIALHQPSAALSLSNRLELDDDLNRSVSQALYLPHAGAAAELGQWPQALAALRAWEVEKAPSLPPRFSPLRQTYLWPRLAYAQARTGDLAGAQALIAATPLDCYLCVRERARIAELAGDRASADRWSAEARRQGPSLPFAFAERGQMLMARGDVDGAIDFYEQAVERGPRWADPQKYWGDALMAQGDEAGAIRKYRAAADRAPRWGALHLAWGRALEAQGRRDQAREKYTEAARMDLSAIDRAEVVRRLGART